ncbi:MAG TPA: potassium-transporting ATPase subunit KdpA [Saprospiraceae bacterium]|nr:potassium-transporting ATPase subunit KdpA [Saprospiraceae bacterium]
MNTEILGVILMYATVLVLAIPLGLYIGKIFNYENTWLNNIFNPLDKIFFKLGGIDPTVEMNWKQHLVALLTINAFWFIISLFILSNMSWLPLNPDGNPSMSWDLAFNTSVSFVSNTNLQHYSGETGLSYLGQLILMLWQFISAATGIAICAVVFNAMKERTTDKLGNFYSYFVRASTRILLPLAFIGAVILVFNGTPMTFEGKATTTTLEGVEQQISRGPAAAFISIKQLGTNGGGYYGPNSTNPMENPNYFTNMLY